MCAYTLTRNTNAEEDSHRTLELQRSQTLALQKLISISKKLVQCDENFEKISSQLAMSLELSRETCAQLCMCVHEMNTCVASHHMSLPQWSNAERMQLSVVKQEIKAMKGIALSWRNFPSTSHKYEEWMIFDFHAIQPKRFLSSIRTVDLKVEQCYYDLSNEARNKHNIRKMIQYIWLVFF